MNKLLLWTLGTLAALPAAAGPYDEPYALVESGWRSDTRKELPVGISSVDGVSTLSPRRSAPIAPGKRQIQINFQTRTGPVGVPYRTLELELESCMRYRVVARYRTLTHLAWEPVVYAEPIGECMQAFVAKS